MRRFKRVTVFGDPFFTHLNNNENLSAQYSDTRLSYVSWATPDGVSPYTFAWKYGAAPNSSQFHGMYKSKMPNLVFQQRTTIFRHASANGIVDKLLRDPKFLQALALGWGASMTKVDGDYHEWSFWALMKNGQTSIKWMPPGNDINGVSGIEPGREPEGYDYALYVHYHPLDFGANDYQGPSDGDYDAIGPGGGLVVSPSGLWVY